MCQVSLETLGFIFDELVCINPNSPALVEHGGSIVEAIIHR